MPELKDVLNLKRVPEEEHGRYSTLAGMMMLLLGRLPHEGDIAEWGGWRLEIVDMDGRRVDKVIAFPAGSRPQRPLRTGGTPQAAEVVPSASAEDPENAVGNPEKN